MLYAPFYDPKKTYEENLQQGPFGAFADGVILEDVGEPEFELFGQKVFSLFGIAPGPLPNGKFIKAALEKAFDIVIHKTVRTRYKPTHSWPNILPVDVEGDFKINSGKIYTKDVFEEPLTILNSFGNGSYEPLVWQPEISEAVKYAKPGQMVGASFEGTKWEGYNAEDYVQDWVLGAKLLKETGVAFIEANLSCPNEGTTALLCYDAQKVEIIVKAIRKEIGTLPLVLKLSYFTNEEELRDLVKRVGGVVEGFSAINTISSEVVDKEGNPALPGVGRKMGGIGGYAVKWAGIDMVIRLKKLREEFGYKFKIIGIGGLMNADDFFEYINTGADVVMSVTGAMWNPYLAKEIKERLR